MAAKLWLAGDKLSPWTSGCQPYQRDKRLKWFDELPKVLQYNKYVRSGYRAGGCLPFQALLLPCTAKVADPC